jgi:transcriptional regulator with XRE-family HTH domain
MIAKLEQGHRGRAIRHETLRRLAQALGVRVEELVCN